MQTQKNIDNVKYLHEQDPITNQNHQFLSGFPNF